MIFYLLRKWNQVNYNWTWEREGISEFFSLISYWKMTEKINEQEREREREILMLHMSHMSL